MPSSKAPVRLAVVMPLGPADAVTDTIESVRHFTATSRCVVVVDDTGDPASRPALEALGEDVHVIEAEMHASRGGGALWRKLCQGFRYVCERAEFDVLLRIDADALVIGPEPERDAIGYFKEHPSVGLIGSYRLDCNAEPRDFGPGARRLEHETDWRGLLRPRLRRVLREAMARASAFGYEPAEHCLGGAYLLSPACVRALRDEGWLDRPELAASGLGEDMICALLVKACGFSIGDFATGAYPLGLRWRGLPAPPAELLERGKKIIHSVRYWQTMDEPAVRGFFAARRGPGRNREPA